MKILVVGKAGQVAQSLIAATKPCGAEIIAFGRPKLDLAKAETIGAVFEEVVPDLIVNAAAYTDVDKAVSEPDAAFLINATGPQRLSEECARRSVPLIHLSTDYVFDGSKTGYYNEEDPVAPLGIYGLSKLTGERHVAAACPHHVILRTAWVYSSYGRNFVKTMLRLAESRSELSIVDDQRGNPTYAAHLADAILAIAGRLVEGNGDDVHWGTYHVAGIGEATWCELAREVFRQSAESGGPSATVRAIATADYPTPAERPSNSRLDCSKLEADYGLRLPNWRIGVTACVRDLIASTRTKSLD